jgi:hypothetical protein
VAGSNGADGPTRAGPRKVESVTALRDKLSRATSAIVTDYRGLTVAQLEELRATLRASQVEYLVVKNTSPGAPPTPPASASSPQCSPALWGWRLGTASSPCPPSCSMIISG